ncbi:PREDICTED: uncharacterized protein LOC106808038 [Priapulus caudatus]|uniref:Uncharacterized protein LOC106808038 n=1 Tax=Priapulus caudatus TaxID=37621 RepID=A0ABM1E1K2_PRICU|nr:PREDICTED: uncharacterized protein LOC106808038 [Priapulus caudatus]
MVEGPLEDVTEHALEVALREMSSGKAAGPTGVTSDLVKAAGREGIRELGSIVKELIGGNGIPEDWKNSSTIPIYKGKGDAMVCGKHRGERLLEHAMKIYARVLEKRLRKEVDIGSFQFGFWPGRSTTGAIFVLRQLQEKYNQKKKKLYYIFVDLEKAFDPSTKRSDKVGLKKEKST